MSGWCPSSLVVYVSSRCYATCAVWVLDLISFCLSRRRYTRFDREWCTFFFFFFSSRRRHTRSDRDWSSDVCSSDLHRYPSMMTYIIRPKTMMIIHRRGRSIPMWSSLPLPGESDRRIYMVGSGGKRSRGAKRLASVARSMIAISPRSLRSFGDQLEHVADAGAKHRAVHDDEKDKCRGKGQSRMVRHRILGAHHTVDHPWLPADLGRQPAGKDRDQPRRPHQRGKAQEKPGIEQAPTPAEEQAP